MHLVLSFSGMMSTPMHIHKLYIKVSNYSMGRAFMNPIQVNSNCTIVCVYDYVACTDPV